MTFARAFVLLLAAPAALAGQDDGEETCWTGLPGDMIVQCDGLTNHECRRQNREQWYAAGRECCDGWEESFSCGVGVGGEYTYCRAGCVEITLSVSVGASSVTLTLDQAWGEYSGTTALTWEGGSGASVTLAVAEFSPTGGPTLAGGDLRARTTAGLSSWTSLGASTSYTVVPTSSTPGTVTVSWAVRDRPSYSTGTYSAAATFTIAEP